MDETTLLAAVALEETSSWSGWMQCPSSSTTPYVPDLPILPPMQYTHLDTNNVEQQGNEQEMHRQYVVNDFCEESMRVVRPTVSDILFLPPPIDKSSPMIVGYTSDFTQLSILTPPKSLLHNNAAAKNRFTTVVFVYKGVLPPPDLLFTDTYSFSICLRVIGSPTTYFTEDIEIKNFIVDNNNRLIQIEFKIKKVSSKVQGSPYSFALFLKPKVEYPGLLSQVSETGNIFVKSQKAKAPSLTKLETSLLSMEWINCYCMGQGPRFCPNCRVPEYLAHKTTCFFHDIHLKQHRISMEGTVVDHQNPSKKRKVSL
jgi:hypothetical protein